MCYKCEVCSAVVAHKTPAIRHIIHRRVPLLAIVRDSDTVKRIQKGWRSEIHREVLICPTCKSALDLGVPFATLLKQHGLPIRLASAAERARRLATPPPALPVRVVTSMPRVVPPTVVKEVSPGIHPVNGAPKPRRYTK